MIAIDCSTINPGPIQNPCGECSKAVKSNQRTIECEECYVWFHKRCLGINSVNFKILEQHPSYVWICCNCGLPSFTSLFLQSNLEYTNRFALLSDSVEYANEASPLHISSLLHSTPKRTNKRNQRSDATSAVQYSPIGGAQPKTSDQINTSHDFSCTVSHSHYNTVTIIQSHILHIPRCHLTTSPALMPVLNIPPTFRLQRNTTKYKCVPSILAA